MPARVPTGIHAPAALLPEGLRKNVDIAFGDDGTITGIEAGVPRPGFPRVQGPVLPGMCDAHSHSFQRALVGRTQRLEGRDDFWSWRNAMYTLVDRLDPDDVQVITEMVYVDLLRNGYTSAGEFHYLHHAPGGTPYDDPAEMARRVLQASQDAGIGLCLLPVLYRWKGFDQGPVDGPAARFSHELDAYLNLLDTLEPAVSASGGMLGLAPHSLRAVSVDDLDQLRPWLDSHPQSPVHIHVAEQVQEVTASVHHTGMSPIALLADRVTLDGRWNLVHATHATAEELLLIEQAGACIVLCPTTEADLGDGLFPWADWLDRGGRFCIGSDANVSVSPVEELRLLLYSARLQKRRRGVLPPTWSQQHGAATWSAAARDGARSLGLRAGRIEVGARADLVILDENAPLFAGCSPGESIDAFVFSGASDHIAQVIVSGITRIADGLHPREHAVRRAYRATLLRLQESIA